MDFPMWMYCEGEEPVLVHSQRTQDALGPAWGEKPPGAGSEPAVPRDRAAYQALSEKDALGMVDRVNQVAVLKRFLVGEITHPHHRDGRGTVLEALDAKLEALTEATS